MTWSEPEFGEIAAVLTRTCGSAFPASRRAFAEAAFRRAIAAAGERPNATYLARLAEEPAVLERLIAEVNVGETYFFRDPAQFQVLRETVVPELLRAARGRPLRVWSAGCSTGEEAYSLAMLLAEAGAGDAAIVASDVSPAAVATARRGRYGAWSFRGATDAWRDRRFVRSGNRWAVAARYRNVDFHVHNVLHGALAGGNFDVILCRNVLLYLDPDALERAAHSLAAALAPGGVLLTSPTDPLPPAGAGLEAALTPAGLVFRRRVAPPAAPAEPSRTPAARRAPAAPARPHPPRPRGVLPAPPVDAEPQLARALALLDAGQAHQAAAAARRAIFLDRTLALAHLTLGRALRVTGRGEAARRALHRSLALLDAHDPGAAVRGAGGTQAGRLRAVAAAELDLLARSAVS